MKYMLLIYFDEQAGPSEAEREHCYQQKPVLAEQLSQKRRHGR